MFDVGDLVIGNDKNRCVITHEGSICLVLELSEINNMIRVCVISDNIGEYDDSVDVNPKNHKNDDVFWVDDYKFDLFTGFSPDDLLTGVFFRKDVKNL